MSNESGFAEAMADESRNKNIEFGIGNSQFDCTDMPPEFILKEMLKVLNDY